jgi:5-methylcytosine-specific restriction endonuclease McrA
MSQKHLTRAEVAGLDLFDTLADHLDAKRGALVKKVVGRGRDKRRMFKGVIRADIYTRDGGVCWYCNASVQLAGAHIDHVIPWSRGGRTNLHNGVVSCAKCNTTKGAKVW